jgi:hypothetical protein
MPLTIEQLKPNEKLRRQINLFHQKEARTAEKR